MRSDWQDAETGLIPDGVAYRACKDSPGTLLPGDTGDTTVFLIGS